MLRDVLFLLWLFVPAGAANVAPVLVAKLPLLSGLDMPLDLGHKFRGVRVFGSHKTWRGLVAGVLMAIAAFWAQRTAQVHLGWFADYSRAVDYRSLSALGVFAAGALFALGALGGDAVESFFKRQFAIMPGKSWFPFDQIDYVVGSIITTLGFIALTAGQYVEAVIVWLVMHLVGSLIGYKLRLKDSPI